MKWWRGKQKRRVNAVVFNAPIWTLSDESGVIELKPVSVSLDYIRFGKDFWQVQIPEGVVIHGISRTGNELLSISLPEWQIRKPVKELEWLYRLIDKCTPEI